MDIQYWINSNVLTSKISQLRVVQRLLAPLSVQLLPGPMEHYVLHVAAACPVPVQVIVGPSKRYELQVLRPQ